MTAVQRSRVVWCASFIAAAFVTVAAPAAARWPRQLSGIEAVNLYVHLPSVLSAGDAHVADSMKVHLGSLLQEAGVEVSRPSAQTLALDVDSVECDSQFAVRVLLRLTEPVRVLRDPTLSEFDKQPITWYEERLFTVSATELESEIRRQADELVGQFAGWIRIQREGVPDD